MLTTSTITACPSDTYISAARDVLRRWQLHYYQLLYFQQPRLIEPGEGSRPFNVAFEVAYGFVLRLRLNVPANRDYDFIIVGPRHNAELKQSQEDYDREILDKCHLIQEAIASRKKKPHGLACCGLAVTMPCVCSYSCKCPIHGGKCVGSHD